MIASAASVVAAEPVATAGEAKAWARALGMALVFGVLCWLGTALTRFGGDIASVWPANAVLLGLLVLDERRDLARRLGLAFLANVAADLWAQSPALEALFLSCCNVVELAIVLVVIHHRPRLQPMTLDAPGTLLEFFVGVCLVPALASAAFAAIGLAYLKGADVTAIFGAWFRADACGLALLTPVVLYVARGGRASFRGVAGQRLAGALAFTLVVAGITFGQSSAPLLFLCVPPLALAAFAGGFTGASYAVLLTAAVGLSGTLLGHGPLALMAHVSLAERVLMLQLFLSVCALTILPMAAVLEERARLHEALRQQATTDALTGVGTRTHLEQLAPHLLASHARRRAPLSAVMLDVDFFKKFNDRYGHLEGDRALREVAKVLRRTFQRATDVVTRFGGEEFAVLLPETSAEDAQRLAGKVHAALQSEALEHKEHPEGRVTVSIGVVTTLAENPPSLAELLERADQALYRAKHAGRNRTEVWATPHDAVDAPIPLRGRARAARR